MSGEHKSITGMRNRKVSFKMDTMGRVEVVGKKLYNCEEMRSGLLEEREENKMVKTMMIDDDEGTEREKRVKS